MSKQPPQEAIDTAEEVVKSILSEYGLDYTAHKLEIAQFFDDYLWNGNWDMLIDFDNMPRLRFIQEDEYDQHMGDEQPEYDVFSGGHYIIVHDA